MRNLWRLVMFALPMAVLVSGCYKEDINELKRRADQHDALFKTISEWKEMINGDIVTLQQLITALQANDYVTGVQETAGGYVISFKNAAPITIKHGQKGDTGDKGAQGDKGDKGDAPVVTIDFHEGAGAHCWKVNGEWMLVNGQVVVAVGKDGQNGNHGQDGNPGQDGEDGVTPVIGVRAGNPANDELATDYYWTVTVDDETSDILGPDDQPLRANGGKGDSFFSDVNNDDPKYLVVTLADGTVISLKKYVQIGLVWPDNGTPGGFQVFGQGQEQTVHFTYTGREYGDTYIYPVYVLDHTRGWDIGIVSDEGGSIYVKAPDETPEYENARALIALLDKKGDIIRTYQIELTMRTATMYQVGDIYYEYGIPVGIVYKVNDGTPNSGRVVHKTEVNSLSWSRAGNWAQGLGDGWRLPTRDDLNTLYTVWAGGDQGVAFNALLSEGVMADGVGIGTEASGRDSKLYWTSTETGAINAQAYVVRFSDGTNDTHGKFESYSARAVREF